VVPQKVKRNPQGEWIAALHRSAEDPAAPAHIKRVLSRLQNCGDNVPRKLKKFINFSMNSLQMRGRDALLTQTFEFIMSHWPKPAPKPAAGASETKQEGDAGASTDESKSDSPGSGSGSAAAGDDDTPAPLAKKAKKEKKVKKDKKAKKDKAAEATVTTDSVGASKKRPRAEEDDGASVSPKRVRCASRPTTCSVAQTHCCCCSTGSGHRVHEKNDQTHSSYQGGCTFGALKESVWS